MGLAAFAIGCGVYIRKRVGIQRILQEGEPIAVDGWNTFPDDPEFPETVRSQQNEAFRQFCHVSLYALVAIAAAYGLDIKADVFSFLLDPT